MWRKIEKRVAILISVIGASNYELLQDSCAPALPNSKTFKDLSVVLKNHFQPQPTVIAERYKFHERKQKNNESIMDYLADLKKLAANCEFKDFLDEALRDRLVCGLYNEDTRRRLLVERKLSLTLAIEITQSLEKAEKK